MNDEMMAHTFVVESMTVEAGRIIPSPALDEAGDHAAEKAGRRGRR